MNDDQNTVDSWRKSTASITGRIAYCLARRRMKSADLLSWIEELQGVVDGMRSHYEQFLQKQTQKGNAELVAKGGQDARGRAKGY